MRLRWLAPDGSWREAPVAAAGRDNAVAVLVFEPGETALESITVEALLDDRPVLRRDLAVAPAPY
jgi:hypothetical protein